MTRQLKHYAFMTEISLRKKGVFENNQPDSR